MKAVVGLDGAVRGSALVRARVQGAGLVVAADGGRGDCGRWGCSRMW